MKPHLLWLPPGYIKRLDELINEKWYPNRNEAIRVAIRDLFKFHENVKKIEELNKNELSRSTEIT